MRKSAALHRRACPTRIAAFRPARRTLASPRLRIRIRFRQWLEFRRVRRPLRGGHAQRPHATALGERPSCGHAVERKADMTSDERVHLVRCGPERNVGHARAGGAHEQNHTKMRRGAVAARAVINLAVFPLQIGNQLRDVVNGQFVPDDQKSRKFNDRRDRCKIFFSIVRQLGKERGLDRMGADGTDQQGMAIVRCTRNQPCSNASTGATPILDHDRYTVLVLKLLPEYACHQIGRTSGAKWHHYGERLRGQTSWLRAPSAPRLQRPQSAEGRVA